MSSIQEIIFNVIFIIYIQYFEELNIINIIVMK